MKQSVIIMAVTLPKIHAVCIHRHGTTTATAAPGAAKFSIISI
jgi:hypothetical protein